MKKKISFMLCPALVLALTIGGTWGCSSGRAGQYQQSGVSEVLEQGMAEADNKKAENSGQAEENEEQNLPDPEKQETQTPQQPAEKPDTDPEPEDRAEDVDVDLTALSSTMVYSEVYNMMTAPESYVGKTVRMKGLFSSFHDETTDKYYFACIVQDATACCAQGIEFVLTDDYVYPEDYPEADEEICVVGTFDTYMEGENTYCTLRDAKLV